MGRVKVLYFASIKDTVGQAEDIIETHSMRLETVLEEIQRLHPVLEPVLADMKAGRSSTILAVNQVFYPTLQDCQLQDASEIAFIAPISGG